jgi:N-acetylglucosamine-6-sulfatase
LASRRGCRAALAATVATLGTLSGLLGDGGAGVASAPSRPNVLMIVTDDQPVGMTRLMPTLDRAPGFVRFSSYYANNPLCCPTRATLLTGQYSHHTGVETNLVASRFDDSSTLASWLDAAGYETGLFGKYLNGYPWNRGSGYVPPGWDRWSAFTPDAAYYDYTLVGERSQRRYGSSPREYSTDVLAAQVDEFIRSAEAPFFAYFAPYAPHAPRTPAPRHRGAFAAVDVKLPRNFNRVASDAPRWWAARPRLDAADARRATKDQWRSLLAVDDAIARFMGTLEERGQSDDTVIVFLSDNGYSLGSHRNPWKDCAYEECVHLPLLVRWPGHTEGGTIDALTSSIDIAPTIAELAGVSPSAPTDGHSLVPLLGGEQDAEAGPILLRHVKYPRVAPSFWGVRTRRWTFVVYESGERELYDNRADPDQLHNLAARRRYGQLQDELQDTIAELRSG